MSDLGRIFGHKKTIDSFLRTFLTKKGQELSLVSPWGNDSINRLIPFVTAGKSIRGCLVLSSYLWYQKRIAREVLRTAAGIELLHSGLLIHDDIMDRDQKRRGGEAIHAQYQKLSTRHFGESMGIAAGDLAFFLGFELLSPQIAPYVAAELSRVAVAQMHDVAPRKNSKEDIMRLYTYKTARYTFSLPLALGALLAHAPQKIIEELERLGEALGILYQIRDDLLDKTQTQITKGDAAAWEIRARKGIGLLGIPPASKRDLLALLQFIMIRKK